MPPRSLIPAILLAFPMALTSCGRSPSQPAITIEGVDQVTLYSIYPFEETEGDGEAEDSFHDYRVLGRLEIEDPGRIEELLGAFNEGVERGGEAVDCFWPRHGLRIVRGGLRTDYLICFECYQFIIYQGGSAVQKTVARSPQTVFDSYLEEAAVPRATLPWESRQSGP